MFGLLGPTLSKCLASKTGLTKEEADMATSSEFVQYTESCRPLPIRSTAVYGSLHGRGIQRDYSTVLVTDDHPFLRLSSNRGSLRRYYAMKLRLFLGSERLSRSSWLVK